MEAAYSRRIFMKQSSLGSAGLMLAGGIAGCSVSKNFSSQVPSGESKGQKIGGMSLEQLRDQYKTALFDRFLSNMDSLVIDHQFGGFMCDLDIKERRQLSSNKKVWSEGRGIWVYSFLYNQFGQDPHFLEVARKSVEFILKHKPADDSFWISAFSREGQPLSGPGDIYGNLYLAEGLAEYSKASGEPQYLELAGKILISGMACYDKEDYSFPISYGPAGAAAITAPRVLAHWMVFLRCASQFLEQKPDPVIGILASRCVEAIMQHHLSADTMLLHEGLRHDFSLPGNEWGQFIYFATGIQSLWIVIAEAVRTKNEGLFNKAQQAFKTHLTLAADPVYGGYFRSLDNMDLYTYKLDKVLSLQEEVLIGSLMLIEHTQDPSMYDCFAQTYSYVQQKFFYPEYAFMVEGGNRRMTEFNKKGVGNYHHPRHLMLNILALERMIKQGGKTSGLFG